jgi:predicted ArsR family transcriptional regulator
VFEVLKETFGEEAAKKAIGLAIRRAAQESGRQLAKEMGGGNLANFIALQPRWTQGEALKVEVLAQDSERFDYDVTSCAYAEMYRELGLGDVGFLLSCNRDEAFIQGFAPEVELRRGQTIMEGAPRCDFRYRVRP